MTRKISTVGIAACILYFLSVGAFLITQTETALTIWELMTVIGAPVVLIVLVKLVDLTSESSVHKKATLAFMSCTCALTGLAHIVNIAVTRPLIAQGVNVPEYFQIGFWPSVEMATDYLAWGFFCGLSFLCAGTAINSKDKLLSRIKVTALICGILCQAGFWGTLFINENIWYAAPMGYGFGTVILCLQMLKLDRTESKKHK